MVNIKPLKRMPYAQAKVHIDTEGTCTYLVSYSTCVAYIDQDGLLTVNGLYSMTTRRHLSAFAAEYCHTNYRVLKRCYNEHLAYNIIDKVFINLDTKEIVE